MPSGDSGSGALWENMSQAVLLALVQPELARDVLQIMDSRVQRTKASVAWKSWTLAWSLVDPNQFPYCARRRLAQAKDAERTESRRVRHPGSGRRPDRQSVRSPGDRHARPRRPVDARQGPLNPQPPRRILRVPVAPKGTQSRRCWTESAVGVMERLTSRWPTAECVPWGHVGWLPACQVSKKDLTGWKAYPTPDDAR